MIGKTKTEEAPLIEARNVTRRLSGEIPVTLVHDIDLAIHRGEFTTITGPSGSGKSSLLYLLGLLDQPTEGTIFMDHIETSDLHEGDLARLRLTKLGFIFQFHFLLPEFTARENIMIPMRKLDRLHPAEMQARADEILAQLDISDHANKRPDQMSGGQRQRVAIARALANDPEVVLADESTGNLDSHNSEIVFDIFTKLAREDGRAVVAVTHEHELADRADRKIHLVDGAIVSDN